MLKIAIIISIIISPVPAVGNGFFCEDSFGELKGEKREFLIDISDKALTIDFIRKSNQK